MNIAPLISHRFPLDKAVEAYGVLTEDRAALGLLLEYPGQPITELTRQTIRLHSNDVEKSSLGQAPVIGFIGAGTVHYFANGSKNFSKERLEVFAAGRILQLDNFRILKGYNWPGFKKMKLMRQDKGQKACAEAFVKAIAEGSESPIPFDELFEVSRISIELAQNRKCNTG